MMTKSKDSTINDDVGECIRVMDDHHNPIRTFPNLSSRRPHNPPLMGTSACAVKRRIDSDMGPVCIEGTDIYNQRLQHHYQNVRKILEEQRSDQLANIEQSRSSSNQKRNFLKRQFPSLPSTYDSSTNEQQQQSQTAVKVVTTTPTMFKNATLLSPSASSIDHSHEQYTNTRNLTNLKAIKTHTRQPVIRDYREQHQDLIEPKNHLSSWISSIPTTKTSGATNLDQVQSDVDVLVDDHQAIQKLTRVLQEHNLPTVNECKPLPSQTNSMLIDTNITTTSSSGPVHIESSEEPLTSEFTVIGALLDNPLGTNDVKKNTMLHARFNKIRLNLQNSEYMNMIKQSTTKEKKSKKKSKKENKKNQTITMTDKETQITGPISESTCTSSEQIPLLNSKNEKKQNKKSKTKSKKSFENNDYQVIDALIGSPISRYLPYSYLEKYRVPLPLSQKSDANVEKQTVNNLVRVVDEFGLHHATTRPTTTENDLRKQTKSMYQRQPMIPFHQSKTQSQSDPIKPRTLYRYIDEKGNILKVSTIPPSQLTELTLKQYSYEHAEPTGYFHHRQTSINDKYRCHPRPEYQQYATLKNQLKTPSLIKREDSELETRPIRQLSERSSSSSLKRTIPISIECEPSVKTPSQQPRTYDDSNQSNVKLTRLPLSSRSEQSYIPTIVNNYNIDLPIKEYSSKLRHTYDYIPMYTHYYYHRRPILQSAVYYNHLPSHTYYSSSFSSPISRSNRHQLIKYDSNTLSRNYIEVFRDGETRPSECYSLPIDEPMSTNYHYSFYKPYERENNFPSLSFDSTHEKFIPLSLNQYPRTAENSPDHDKIAFNNYLRQSKSFDYRPLHTKLQREYKITPNLLVDEWDYHQKVLSTDYDRKSNIS